MYNKTKLLRVLEPLTNVAGKARNSFLGKVAVAAMWLSTRLINNGSWVLSRHELGLFLSFRSSRSKPVLLVILI